MKFQYPQSLISIFYALFNDHEWWRSIIGTDMSRVRTSIINHSGPLITTEGPKCPPNKSGGSSIKQCLVSRYKQLTQGVILRTPFGWFFASTTTDDTTHKKAPLPADHGPVCERGRHIKICTWLAQKLLQNCRGFPIEKYYLGMM